MPAQIYRSAKLADFLGPVFQSFLDQSHELVGDRTIDDAMVVSEGEMDDGPDRNGIVSVFVGNDHGLFGDATDTHNCGVRLIDDGQTEDRSKLAGIGDREG